ncbi:hypothetical protein QAD02_009635 [Eretmocerus hayati]|uniref:Uncharacterized protein n=1 Tax=Eretmocerus hayati TaxID=131215 RepID=A0ACC2NA85_9HYME|nr:hypothetical protein QAD02_009635 [Eretmocerus hayati]
MKARFFGAISKGFFPQLKTRGVIRLHVGDSFPGQKSWTEFTGLPRSGFTSHTSLQENMGDEYNNHIRLGDAFISNQTRSRYGLSRNPTVNPPVLNSDRIGRHPIIEPPVHNPDVLLHQVRHEAGVNNNDDDGARHDPPNLLPQDMAPVEALVFIISYHQKRLRILNEGISAIFARDLEIPENRPHLLAHAKTFGKMFWTFDYFIASNLTLIIIIPLTMIRHGKYVRMYPQVLPFTYEPGGLVHWIIYAYEVHFSYYLWTVTCGVDSYLGLYALHIVGETKLLTHRFLNLKSGENYRRNLKDIIDRHSALAEAQHLLEEVFGFLVLWLAVTCAMILCFVIFQATSSGNFSFLKILMIFTWTTLKLIQAFSYSWYGNIIAVENQNCLDAIYFAKWVDKGDLRIMKDALIVLAQTPLIFTAKGIMRLDFNMFSKIVNTSVSYFFLLQTLEEKASE